MISFAWPFMFLLLPLPWLAYRYFPVKNAQQHHYLFMPLLNASSLEASHAPHANTSRWRLAVLAGIWCAVVAATAKPERIGDMVELPNTGRDLLLAVDISGSMQIPDMTINNNQVDRLTMIKHVVAQFLEKRQGDRVGLILFGSNAYIQAPLTFDLKTVNQLLQESEIGFAGDATAVGDAIGLGIKRLNKNPANSRVMILLTDGQSNAGAVTPQQAAQLAQQENVVVYTIGIGSDKIMSSGLFGMNRYSASQDLDEETLKQIAATTHGRYFRAKNTDELNGIYDAINQLETIDQKAEFVHPKESLFFWPLGLAMLISIIASITSSLSSRMAKK